MTCSGLKPRTIIRQDSDIFNVTFKDSEGELINITDWTVRCTVRTEIPATSITDDTDPAAKISVIATIPSPETGVAVFNIPSSDTNIEPTDKGTVDYFYDIQYTKANGDNKSLGYSDYIILPDITRDI